MQPPSYIGSMEHDTSTLEAVIEEALKVEGIEAYVTNPDETNDYVHALIMHFNAHPTMWSIIVEDDLNYLDVNPAMPKLDPHPAVTTIKLTDEPSRSKQAGPCWISIEVDDTAIYAGHSAKDLAVTIDETYKVKGKATLRRSTRTDTARDEWTVKATGNPDDVAVLRVGSPQAVEVELIGFVEV